MNEKDQNLKIDEALESTDSIRQMVASLPDETPSLAWRSQLNERIYQSQSKVHKRVVFWKFFAPATSVAACCVAYILIAAPFRAHSVDSNVAVKRTIEDEIISNHVAQEVESFTGTAIGSEPINAPTDDNTVYWSREDLESF